MPLELFDDGATRSVMADWLETKVYCENVTMSHADLIRSQSVREDPVNGGEFDDETGEYLDAEILDTRADSTSDAVWAELKYRQRLLGVNYPFVLESRPSGGWSLSLAPRDGGASLARRCYLVCLLVASLRRGILTPPKSDWANPVIEAYKSLTKSAADVFQAASFLAAPAMVDGTAHWFGWPRPDATSKMRGAIERLIERIGHGKLKQKDPEWTTGYEKDGTVDIVVWRPFWDRHYGSVVVFGQVASGENWRGKSINTFLKGHFFDWFEDRPTEQYLAAMFIPFTLHDDAKESKHANFAQVAQAAARRDESDYGVVLDRLRLTELASARVARRSEIDDFERKLITRITRWIVLARAYAVTEPAILAPA